MTVLIQIILSIIMKKVAMLLILTTEFLVIFASELIFVQKHSNKKMERYFVKNVLKDLKAKGFSIPVPFHQNVKLKQEKTAKIYNTRSNFVENIKIIQTKLIIFVW